MIGVVGARRPLNISWLLYGETYKGNLTRVDRRIESTHACLTYEHYMDLTDFLIELGNERR